MVRYLDAGTLILRSPLEWKARTQPVLTSDPLHVQVGDIVWVAQRVGPERKEVALAAATIASIVTIRRLSVYKLKGLDGRPVQQGDSGGGVWYKGKLVANLWYAEMAGPATSTLLSSGMADGAKLEVKNESYAANCPAAQFYAFQEHQVRIGSQETSVLP